MEHSPHALYDPPAPTTIDSVQRFSGLRHTVGGRLGSPASVPRPMENRTSTAPNAAVNPPVSRRANSSFSEELNRRRIFDSEPVSLLDQSRSVDLENSPRLHLR